jgi:hypothetical protein
MLAQPMNASAPDDPGMATRLLVGLCLAGCSGAATTSSAVDAPIAATPDAGPQPLVLQHAVNVFSYGVGDFAGDGSTILVMGGDAAPRARGRRAASSRAAGFAATARWSRSRPRPCSRRPRPPR